MTTYAGPAPSQLLPDGYVEQDEEGTQELWVATEVPKIVELACRFAAKRGRPAAVYLLGAGDAAADRPDVPMTRRTVEQLESTLRDRTFADLDLIIQSSGGDIHAAYHLMSLLRGRMIEQARGTLAACVSSRAQSAATLLCLGADEILLGELGSLGPLDAQIRKGSTDVGTPNYVSALHLLKGLNRLQRFSLESFTDMAAHLHEHQVSREDQLKYGIAFSRAITGPLFERIDSESVGYWDQMLQTGEEYGRRLLERGKLVKDEELKKERKDHIADAVHTLVFDYPSHELVIDCGVLDRLHLRSSLMPLDVRPIARAFTDCAAETLIMFVDPLTANAVPDGATELTLKEWRSIGTDLPTRDIVWDDRGRRTYSMRVALYRPIVTPRNPWHESRVADGGPATQYTVPLGLFGGR